MMNSEQHFALIMRLIEQQAPALFVVEGTVYEGRLESCLRGELTAVVRPYGTHQKYERRTWMLSVVEDLGGALHEDADEDEDPLFEQARELVKRANEYGELSLAERLVADRVPRGDT